MISESWQKNLYAISVAQFLVTMAINFVAPFLPLFIQELGSFTNKEAALWAGIATGGLGVALFFSAPLWGIVADRWGRKPMVLRAQFGTAITIALMSLAPNIYYIVVLRFIQGLFTGTMSAASALVASTAPRDKMPFAMGLLMMAYFTGQTFGPLLGGSLADIVGYKATFFITGGLISLGGLIILFLVKESFERPAPGKGASVGSLWHLAMSRAILPLLMTQTALQMGTQMIQPVISLSIRELDPEGMAATISGLAFCLMGIIAAGSSWVSGRLAGRLNLKKVLVFSCLGVGLLHLPPVWAGTVAQLVIFIALTGLFKGGLLTSANALVGLSVPQSEAGAAYGVVQSGNSLGVGIGPLIGGGLAPLIGLRPVYGVAGGLFIILGIALPKLLKGGITGRPSTQEVGSNP